MCHSQGYEVLRYYYLRQREMVTYGDRETDIEISVLGHQILRAKPSDGVNPLAAAEVSFH